MTTNSNSNSNSFELLAMISEQEINRRNNSNNNNSMAVTAAANALIAATRAQTTSNRRYRYHDQHHHNRPTPALTLTATLVAAAAASAAADNNSTNSSTNATASSSSPPMEIAANSTKDTARLGVLVGRDSSSSTTYHKSADGLLFPTEGTGIFTATSSRPKGIRTFGYDNNNNNMTMMIDDNSNNNSQNQSLQNSNAHVTKEKGVYTASGAVTINTNNVPMDTSVVSKSATTQIIQRRAPYSSTSSRQSNSNNNKNKLGSAPRSGGGRRRAINYSDYSSEQPLPEERDCWALSTRTTSSPVFPLKLHETLTQIESDGYDHIIGWLPHGRSFKIFKQKEFTEIILPR